MKEERLEDLERLARSFGLDFFPVVFEVLTESAMINVCAYGLPTRARHWSHGRSFDHQKLYGEMGFSKVYEMITNNDPSYAFVLDSNTEVQNLLIAAHCFGHSDFFKNNVLFQGSDRNMVRHASEHAFRVEQYIHQHGLDAVERIMDIGFALESHIDLHKGLYRRKYPQRHIQERVVVAGEFDDLTSKGSRPLSVIKEIVNATIPPHPEKDLLWFFINYAPLEEWERDILDIAREESFYFRPQIMTKIMNEGWASFWHAEILFGYKDMTPEETLDFARTHEKVVQPGANPFSINPYYLGYRVFKDIEKRWDEMYAKGESDITGRQKIFEVRRDEDDFSFLRNYLTEELIRDLKLFTFGEVDKDDSRALSDEEGTLYEIKNRVREEVVEAILRPRYNGCAPKMVVSEASAEGISLRHISEDMGTLDFRHASKVLEYVWELWAAPVELITKDDAGKDVILCFDEGGFSQRFADDDDDDTQETNFLK